MKQNRSALSGITPYIYGTTRLGDKKIPREQRIEVARSAEQVDCPCCKRKFFEFLDGD